MRPQENKDHDHQSGLSAKPYLSRMGHSPSHPTFTPLSDIPTKDLSMAPQTRSTTKSSPGRCTRNSVYGRSPLPPTGKPRKSSTESAAKSARTQEQKSTSKVKKGTPWLACRDEHGVFTTVAVSDTGEGVHVRWYYSEDDNEVNEEADVEMMTTVDKERDATPQPSVADAPSKGTRLPFPQTPMAPQPYDAGSVILTPVKKAKPLQPSPPRIGDKGIRCLFEKDGVLRGFNGEARIVLRHPVGSTTNLSREQVERLENEREEQIVRVQVARLLAERDRVEQERFSEDEMETDDDQSQSRLGREGSNDTVLVSQSDLSDVSQASLEEIASAPAVFRGPAGELLDRQGRQMLGPEGTVLIDPSYVSPGRALREKAFPVMVGNEDHPHPNNAASGLRPPRFGPEGTLLID